MLNYKDQSLFRVPSAKVPNTLTSSAISKTAPPTLGKVMFGGPVQTRRNVAIPNMMVKKTNHVSISDVAISDQVKLSDASSQQDAAKFVDQIESDQSLKKGTQQLIANTKMSKMQVPSSFQMNPMAHQGTNQFGMGINSHLPHSKSNGNRSGLMNLQMNLKQTSSTSDFKINQTIDDTDKASKEVFIQENFIDSKFKDEQVMEPDLEKWKFQIPVWQTGLDRKLIYPNQLLDHKRHAKDTINRSMNPFDPTMTPLGKKTIMKLQHQLQAKTLTVDQMYDSMRDNLQSYFDLPKGTGIFYAPSKATAQYLILMIASGIHTSLDDRFKYKSIFTGQMRDQIDKNIKTAAKGRYFSTEVIPNEEWRDRVQPQKKDWVPGLPSACSVEVLQAQSDLHFSDAEQESKYYKERVQNLINSKAKDEVADEKNKLIIMQSMGALDKQMEEMWWKDLDGLKFDDELRVYNHFEGRVDKKQLHKHLENGDLFVFSGTNYYRGPLQCAAIFVPPKVMESLQTTENLYPENLRSQWTQDGTAPSSLNCFFGKNDIPKELKIWRENIEDNQNPGLALRWSAAIASMNEMKSYNDELLEQLERSWSLQMAEVMKNFPILSYEHDAKNATINVALKSDQEDQAWLNQQDLSLLQKMMETDMSDKIDYDWYSLYWTSSYEDSQEDIFSCMDLDELKKIASKKILITSQPQKSKQGSDQFALQISLNYDDIAAQLNNSHVTQSVPLDYIMNENDVNVIYKLVILAYALPQLKAEMSVKFQREGIQNKFEKESIKKNFFDSQVANLKKSIKSLSEDLQVFNNIDLSFGK